MYKWDGGFSLVEGKKGAFIKNRPALTSSDLGGQMKEFSLSAENAENSVLAPSAGLWLWKVNRSLCNLTQVHWVVNVIVWVCGFCYFRLAFYPPPPWLSAPPWRMSPRSNYPHLSGVHPLCAACSLCQLVCSLFPESVPVSPSLISPWCVSCFWFLVLSCFSVFFFLFCFCLLDVSQFCYLPFCLPWVVASFFGFWIYLIYRFCPACVSIRGIWQLKDDHDDMHEQILWQNKLNMLTGRIEHFVTVIKFVSLIMLSTCAAAAGVVNTGGCWLGLRLVIIKQNVKRYNRERFLLGTIAIRVLCSSGISSTNVWGYFDLAELFWRA